MNEKVRARRAKQTSDDEIDNASAEPELQPATEPAPVPGREARPATTLSPANESPSFFPENTYSRRRRTEAVPRAYSSASLQTASSNNPVVQAALSRARRASETASRAALPRIESNRPLPAAAKNTVAVDRDATARVLEPAPEIDAFSTAPPASQPEFSASSYTQPEHGEPVAAHRIATAPPIVPDERPSYAADDLAEAATTVPIDELEPCDYLEAEVRRVDKALSAEFSRNESPSLGTHVVINVIDLLVVAISCLPFMAAIALANGSFDSFQTRMVSIGIIALVSFLYLGLTHCLCGKTIGMMLTNTRIVDATSFGDPTRKRALMRAAGYFLAIAPALVGLLWIAGNPKRRGWHDFISGTFVARDF
ncbi:MAG TPA: RDD family protein [Blastocatellia bacterium]|nr:RDD family protein [Blastocatellia bacterium]